MWSCEQGNLVLAQRLLDAGANPNHKAWQNETPWSVCVGPYAQELQALLSRYGGHP